MILQDCHNLRAANATKCIQGLPSVFIYKERGSLYNSVEANCDETKLKKLSDLINVFAYDYGKCCCKFNVVMISEKMS